MLCAPCATPQISTTALFFFFNDPATTEIYTLSLHDALPISMHLSGAARVSSLRPTARFISSRGARDRKSTRLNSSHVEISYAVFCLKKKKKQLQCIVTAPADVPLSSFSHLPCDGSDLEPRQP